MAGETSEATLQERTIVSAEADVKQLGNVAELAKAVTDTVVLELSEDCLAFWGIDDGRTVSFNGTLRGSNYTDVEGGSSPVAVRVSPQSIVDALKIFSKKKPVTLMVLGAFGVAPDLPSEIHLVQGTETKSLAVASAEVDPGPVIPDTEPVAFAEVDLKEFTQSVTAYKRKSDLLNVAVRDGAFTVWVETREARESWVSELATHGSCSVLFHPASLLPAVKGAARIAERGAVHLAVGQATRIEATGEEAGVTFFVTPRTRLR